MHLLRVKTFPSLHDFKPLRDNKIREIFNGFFRDKVVQNITELKTYEPMLCALVNICVHRTGACIIHTGIFFPRHHVFACVDEDQWSRCNICRIDHTCTA